MITSMIQPMITGMITSMIRSSVTGRWFISLDPVANSYYTISSPITLAGDFSITIEFSTVDATNQLLVADSHSASYYLSVDVTNFTLWVVGTPYAFNHSTSYTVHDGKLHIIRYVLTGTSLELFLDGVSLGAKTIVPYTGSNSFLIGNSNSSANYFDGILANVSINDITGGEVTTFELSEPTANYELSVENVFGSELVSNGDFDSTTSPWYTFQSSILSVESEKLRVTNGVSSQRGRAVISLGALEGSYLLSQDTPAGTASAFYTYITTSASGSTTGIIGTESFDSEDVIYGDIAANTYYLVVGCNDATNSVHGDFDNISVKQVTNAVTYNNISAGIREFFTLVDDGVNWLGGELVTNGGFDTDTVWSKGTGWSIGSGKADHSGVSAFSPLSQSQSNIEVVYSYSYDAVVVSGDVFIEYGGVSGLSANSTQTVSGSLTATAAGSNIFMFSGGGGFVGSVDNVSVKRLIQIA